jgi:hypothetical protein
MRQTTTLLLFLLVASIFRVAAAFLVDSRRVFGARARQWVCSRAEGRRSAVDEASLVAAQLGYEVTNLLHVAAWAYLGDPASFTLALALHTRAETPAAIATYPSALAIIRMAVPSEEACQEAGHFFFLVEFA